MPLHRSLRAALPALALFAVFLPGAPGLPSTLIVARAQTAPGCTVDASHLSPDAEEQALLAGANAYRASYGLPPLRLSWSLTVSALWKSTDMAANHYFAHDDATRSWEQRLADCGYTVQGAYMAENLAAGNAGGSATLAQWEASPPHNANLLNPHYTATGIKRVQSPNDPYGWYWTMEFGSTLDHDLT